MSTIEEFAAILKRAEEKVAARPEWLRHDDVSYVKRDPAAVPVKPNSSHRGTPKKTT